MSITRNTNTIYFEDLIKYSLDLIGQKCRNVYRNSQSEVKLPTESEFNNGNEYVFSYGNPSKMYVTPRCNSYTKVQLGEFFGPTSTTADSVAYQLRIFLQQPGVLSKAKSVMTTKSILQGMPKRTKLLIIQQASPLTYKLDIGLNSQVKNG